MLVPERAKRERAIDRLLGSSRGCPRNCRRRARPHFAIVPDGMRRRGLVRTREPGDRPASRLHARVRAGKPDRSGRETRRRHSPYRSGARGQSAAGARPVRSRAMRRTPPAGLPAMRPRQCVPGTASARSRCRPQVPGGWPTYLPGLRHVPHPDAGGGPAENFADITGPDPAASAESRCSCGAGTPCRLPDRSSSVAQACASASAVQDAASGHHAVRSSLRQPIRAPGP